LIEQGLTSPCYLGDGFTGQKFKVLKEQKSTQITNNTKSKHTKTANTLDYTNGWLVIYVPVNTV